MATLKDVAREAGVTVTTVSRVLNNRGYISEATRKKVYDSMEKLNYVPNEVARALTQKHTNSIGIIVPSVRHPYFSEVVDHLEHLAFEKGYKVMLCNSYHQREKEAEYLGMLKSNKVSGIILCSRTAVVEELLKIALPVVSFERVISPDICAVSCDNMQGGYLAASHLIQRGCKKLLHIGGTTQVHMPADDRETAFAQVCRRHGVPYVVAHTQESQFQTMDYEEFLNGLLDIYSDVDGVFASSDLIAAQLIKVCAKRGIRVPEDMKIVGFDDVRLATLTTPTITTIRQPINEMCEKAIECIMQQLNQKYPPSRTCLGVSLIQRETT